MMSVRKKVGLLPTHRLAVRHSLDYSSSYHFTLDDSSRDSSLSSSSQTSSDSSTDALSNSSSSHSSSNHSSPVLPSGLYYKRSRETRLRDDVVEKSSDEPHLEHDIDLEIHAEINECIDYAGALRARGDDARVVVEAVDREEIETGTRGLVEVKVERVTHPAVPDDNPEPAQDEGAVERDQGHIIIATSQQSVVRSEKISELKRDNVRLRGTLDVAINELIERQVAEALEACDAARNLELFVEGGGEQEDGNRGNGNGGVNGNGGNGNRGNGNSGGNDNGNNNGNSNGNRGGNGYNFGGLMPIARECTYQDFLKCQPLNFNGTEGVFRPSDTPVCYLSTCEQCENILNYGTCLNCNSRIGNSFTYDTIPGSYDEVPNPPPQCHFNIYLCQICESNSHYGYECSQRVPFVYEPKLCYILNFSDNNYSHGARNGAHVGYNCPAQGDKHLDTIPAMELEKFIKSYVENLVPNPSESEGETGCDLLACFTTFSNVLFDADYEFDSVDDQSLHNEDVSEEIFSNPLFEEEIISIKIDQHHFNVETDLVESMLNRDSSIISSSSKIDSLLDEFAGELTFLKSIPPGIDDTDCHPKNEIHFAERLLYDNSSHRPPKEFAYESSDADIQSFSPSPIPNKDSDSFIEEINLSFYPDGPMPPSIEDDDDDSERDVLILEELPSNYSLSLPVNESFHFDIPTFSRPPAKPPDGNTGILNIEIMGDNSDQKVPMPKLMITRVSNQEKSPDLLSHRGLEIFKFSVKCPMMIQLSSIPGNVKTLAKGFYPPSLHFLNFS
nr:hypothetical protein [Tanacetum cinerariifolium]